MEENRARGLCSQYLPKTKNQPTRNDEKSKKFPNLSQKQNNSTSFSVTQKPKIAMLGHLILLVC